VSTLRLTANSEGNNRFRVSARLERIGQSSREITNCFPFVFSARDRADFRWYLEDFADFPFGPDLHIAAQVEQRMEQLGIDLWRAIFATSESSIEFWDEVRSTLDETRVEIVADLVAALLPWELLKDPALDAPIALSVCAFVRTESRLPQLPPWENAPRPVRILLVICRPHGSADVEYRSIARSLFDALADNPDRYRIDVLRPATFKALEDVLRAAQLTGEPYHVVHFDGHGGFRENVDPNKSAEGRGYFEFELPGSVDNSDLVDGATVGTLLAETGAPLLVLNACRSGYAQAADTPDLEDVDANMQGPAFTSFAQEAMAAGVIGVVAMRYNVYVVTAVEFMAELYESLSRGGTLGEAVTHARKHLHDDPSRGIPDKWVGPQDWSVPVVYESEAVQLFNPSTSDIGVPIPDNEDTDRSIHDALVYQLPLPPNTGFVGRDGVVLAIDRTFDVANVVLLHGYAGSGKTATAAEFGRWYTRTGGVSVPVIFTSFERPRSLPQVLDDLEAVLGPVLEARGVVWLALSDTQQREVALEVLRRVPVLWIWDNVEEVAGFPSNSDAKLAPAEQRDLAEFLRAACATQGKFLLTSRRAEHGWLDDVPIRITLPGMPLRESMALARAIAKKRGRVLSEIGSWKPLLQYAHGNPLAIHVLVGQALNDELESAEELEMFLSQVQSGEAEFDDQETEGRSRSLGAALSYGFAHAFTEEERSQLALLHLFQGFVTIEQLMWLGHPEAGWSLPTLRGLGVDEIAALLDRAADIGFLTRIAPQLYEIHPALPWYLRRLFDRHYPDAVTHAEQSAAEEAIYAHVRAIAEWGNFWHGAYEHNTGVAGLLAVGESNLLWARRLALRMNLVDQVIPLMQGLRILYTQKGSWGAWKRLVEEIEPLFVGTDDKETSSEYHQEWAIVLGYQIDIEAMMRNWPEVERLARALVDGERRHAAPVLAASPDTLPGFDRHRLLMLSAALDKLGSARRELQQRDCLAPLREAYDLADRVGDRAGIATYAFNIAGCYAQIASIQDLDLAEEWYLRSLSNQSSANLLARGMCHGALGEIQLRRFQASSNKGKQTADDLGLLLKAHQQYSQALAIFPPDATYQLATSHAQLGAVCGWLNAYYNLGDMDETMHHYRKAMGYFRATGDAVGLANLQANVALFLFQSERWREALVYAEAALDGMVTLGEQQFEISEFIREMIPKVRQRLADEEE
jgi:tetratricopeptide (TPR) repeat protein